MTNTPNPLSDVGECFVPKHNLGDALRYFSRGPRGRECQMLPRFRQTRSSWQRDEVSHAAAQENGLKMLFLAGPALALTDGLLDNPPKNHPGKRIG